MDENLCVCCGAVIPEGQQVCKACAEKNVNEGFFVGYAVKDGLRYTASGTFKEMVEWAEKAMENKGISEIRIWREE